MTGRKREALTATDSRGKGLQVRKHEKGTDSEEIVNKLGAKHYPTKTTANSSASWEYQHFSAGCRVNIRP